MIATMFTTSENFYYVPYLNKQNGGNNNIMKDTAEHKSVDIDRVCDFFLVLLNDIVQRAARHLLEFFRHQESSN